MSAEQWRPIEGFPGYFVSDQGRVLSRRRPEPRILVGGDNGKGYRLVGLHRDGLPLVTRGVHRLVARAFLGPRPDGMEIRHLDGDQTNNALSNIVYGTKSQNVRDQLRHGTHAQASKTHCPRRHPYDEVNTRITRAGRRQCRECQRVRRAEARLVGTPEALRAAGLLRPTRAAA